MTCALLAVATYGNAFLSVRIPAPDVEHILRHPLLLKAGPPLFKSQKQTPRGGALSGGSETGHASNHPIFNQKLRTGRSSGRLEDSGLRQGAAWGDSCYSYHHRAPSHASALTSGPV